MLLYGIIIALAILTGILSVLLLLYKKQVKELKKQIDFIAIQDTNLKLCANVASFSDINALIAKTNEVLDKHRNLEIQLKNTNENFKHTITSISHDLRTPLTSANGYIQMLNDLEVPEEKKKEYTTIIESKIIEVKNMLDQLFEYARIQSGEVTLKQEKINVNNILSDAISVFYEDFSSKGMEPNISMIKEPIYIIGDSDALKRIFINILNNAVVHGKGDLLIETKSKEGYITISFRNKTDSIEKEEIDKIFDRFYTTDKSRSRKTTGLGLSIAKEFITKLNGQIKAELEKETFSVIIVLKQV